MTIDEKIAQLEQQIFNNHIECTMLITLIVRNDDALRLKIAENIRTILTHPREAAPVPPPVLLALRTLRDNLLAEPSEAALAAMSAPPIRPVP
jgi:hypothetical protein